MCKMKIGTIKRKLNNVKIKIAEMKARTILKLMGMPLLISTYAMNANATGNGAEAVTGINTLVDLAGNVISAIGAFVILWGIFELGNAMQSHDGAQTGQAGKRVAGGLVMAVAPQLLKLFI